MATLHGSICKCSLHNEFNMKWNIACERIELGQFEIQSNCDRILFFVFSIQFFGCEYSNIVAHVAAFDIHEHGHIIIGCHLFLLTLERIHNTYRIFSALWAVTGIHCGRAQTIYCWLFGSSLNFHWVFPLVIPPLKRSSISCSWTSIYRATRSGQMTFFSPRRAELAEYFFVLKSISSIALITSISMWNISVTHGRNTIYIVDSNSYFQIFQLMTYLNYSVKHFLNFVKTPVTIRYCKCLVLLHVIFYK